MNTLKRLQVTLSHCDHPTITQSLDISFSHYRCTLLNILWLKQIYGGIYTCMTAKEKQNRRLLYQMYLMCVCVKMWMNSSIQKATETNVKERHSYALSTRKKKENIKSPIMDNRLHDMLQLNMVMLLQMMT